LQLAISATATTVIGRGFNFSAYTLTEPTIFPGLHIKQSPLWFFERLPL